MTAQGRKPTVFIGSSKRGLELAECLRPGLKEFMDVTLWTEGVFQPSVFTFEALERAKDRFDYAVLVCTADDLRLKNDHWSMSPRDNVILEWAFFVGAMGRERAILVCEESAEMPSDTQGITVIPFAQRADGNHLAGMGPASLALRQYIQGRSRRMFEETMASLADKAAGLAKLQVTRPLDGEVLPIVERRRRRRSLGSAAMSQQFRINQIVNISVTGALLETEGALPLGQVLDLTLELDDKSTVEVQAKVVRVQEPDWLRVGGVGVAFTNYRGDALQTLERYIDSELEVG